MCLKSDNPASQCQSYVAARRIRNGHFVFFVQILFVQNGRVLIFVHAFGLELSSVDHRVATLGPSQPGASSPAEPTHNSVQPKVFS
jgi:hypothetical protein